MTSNECFVCFHSSKLKERSLPFRKQNLIEAFHWLLDNNPLYRDVYFDFNAIESLPLCPPDSYDIQEYGIIPTNYTSIDKSEIASNINLQMNIDSTPLNILKLNNFEELTFPWLFPYGKSGFSSSRKKKLTLNQYYKARIYNIDPRWRTDISYLMNAVNILEKNTLSQLIGVYMKVHKGFSIESPLLTARDLQLSEINTQLNENSFMFMKKIRGTAAYWKNNLFNLLAMIRNIGPPSLFITLSANDYHWKELAMTLQLCNENEIDLTSLPKHVQNDPLLTAIHFDRRWRALFKYVLKGKTQPLGKVNDYFIRVEFQSRGSPHLHLFLWIDDAPSLTSAKHTTEITSYIDKVISTQIPSKESDPELHDLVTKLQIHSHRKYCQRGGKCRFHFPYKECPATRILSSIELGTNVKQKFYETKRSVNDTMVNPFNPVILRHWKANMDIQMIGGPYGIACYICSYICKAEPDNLKNALAELVSSFRLQQQPKPLKDRMFSIGMCVLKQKTLSAQEAAYRLSDLDFICTSRETVYLSALPPYKQFKRLRPQEEIDLMEPNSTNIFYSNIIDDYHERPYCLENVCLFRYTQWYKKDYSKKSTNLHLLKSKHYLKKKEIDRL